MKLFELSKQQGKDGRRRFKMVLHTVYPDSCVNEERQAGEQYNKNGITWIREYCEAALPSLVGRFLRCEFLDDERTELYGHGETDVQDGEPIFEDATTIGTFTKGYIDEVDLGDGPVLACIGEGYIDSQCYHNFVTKLDADIADGHYPNGSVEIMHTEDNDGIVYKYGYKPEGRIPTEFIYSGYALLGVTPADDNARLLELNTKKKEEAHEMNETEIKAVASALANELSFREAEMNAYKAECDKQVADANQAKEDAIAEKNEIDASFAEIKAALESCKAEFKALDEKYQALGEECAALRQALGEARAKERLGEMHKALEGFSDEEKSYAEAEINAFNENPMEGDVNAIVGKIYAAIGKKAKEDAGVESELNNLNGSDVDDIFSDMLHATAKEREIDIFADN